jgi:hypothetical protein
VPSATTDDMVVGVGVGRVQGVQGVLVRRKLGEQMAAFNVHHHCTFYVANP